MLWASSAFSPICKFPKIKSIHLLSFRFFSKLFLNSTTKFIGLFPDQGGNKTSLISILFP